MTEGACVSVAEPETKIDQSIKYTVSNIAMLIGLRYQLLNLLFLKMTYNAWEPCPRPWIKVYIVFDDWL